MSFEAEVDWTLPESLQQLADSGERDLVAEILSLFQSDTGLRLQRLRTAAECGDRRQVRAEAHSLKGSAVQVGANSMGDSCRELELTAETRPDLLSLVGTIEARFAVVSGAISMEFGTVPCGSADGLAAGVEKR